MSATSHVLSITEILQQILSFLPPLDIIQAQRVCRTWQKLITDSPLLQYKSWLRSDYSDPAHRILATDIFPEQDRLGDEWDYEDEVAYETKRFRRNIANHVNPIVAAKILENPPDDPRNCFHPEENMEQDGFGGYLHFTPLILRELLGWYKKHESSEHVWGHMSLLRPDARKISWSIPTSGGAGIPFHLEAYRDDDPDAGTYSRNGFGNGVRVNMGPERALILTLSDLMGRLESEWEGWIESEHEEHYLSHDGGVCDYDQGIPAERCLRSDDEDENEGMNGEPESGDEEDEESDRMETSGYKMTMEEHIEQAIMAASSSTGREATMGTGIGRVAVDSLQWPRTRIAHSGVGRTIMSQYHN